MVSMVPPCLGPVSGYSWLEEQIKGDICWPESDDGFFFFTQKQYIIEHIMYVSQNDSLLKSLWSSPILKESDTCYLIKGDEK